MNEAIKRKIIKENPIEDLKKPKSSQQGGDSSQQSQSQGGGESSQQGGDSSQGGGHEHSFGEWGPGKTATYTELGSEQRVCECGEKEERDLNTLPYNIDATSEVIKLNSDNKKMSQFTYNNGAAKVAAVSMKENSGVFKTTADGAEKWAIGDDANKAAADTYKLDQGNALLFKVNVTSAMENALLSIGAKYTNARARHFWTEGDRTESDTNGDNPDSDGYRYYTKVGAADFQPIAYNNLMSTVFGDGSEICYMPLGYFNLQAGENLIYVRQGSLGYRVTLQGYLFVELKGTAELGGTVPTHNHTAATAWSSDASKHWHACTGSDCDEPGVKLEEADHTFGEQYDVVNATCEAAGSYKQKCSVCNYVKEGRIAKLDHQYGDMVGKTNAGEGYIATEAYNCSSCEKSALRWKAKDFDATLSDSGLENNSDNVRFKSASVENKGGTEGVGSHIVYKVKVDEAVANAGLAFKIKNTGGNSNVAAVFGPIPNDTSVGYIKNADGTFTESTHRYGLRINDVEYFLGEDDYGNQASVTGWFDWPVSFPLNAGGNKIDVFAYRGYRANMFEFQLTGLPKVENTHTHTLGEWQSDENNHYKLCTDAACPTAGEHLEEAAHTFGEAYDVVQATCEQEGSYKKACSVCGYVKTFTEPKAAHTFGAAQAKVSDATPYECSVCGAMAYQLDIPTPQKLKEDVTWDITGLPAGTYEIELYACAATTTLGQKYDGRYQFKVDGGNYIGASDDNATYASYGLGTGEAIGNCVWSNPINQIALGDAAASFQIHWTNKGFSAFIAAVRLVQVL